MQKIVVMGAGSWGTTIALLLAEKENDVVLWEFDKNRALEMEKDRENKIFLNGKKFPKNLRVVNDMTDILKGASYVVFAIPTQFLRSVLSQLSSQLEENIIIVNLSKGIEIKNHKRISEVIKDEILGKYHKNIVVLSGPTHAEEVSEKQPSAIVAAATDKEIAKKVQELFSTDYFRVYVNTDIVGVEIGAALKNCIAIAAGITDGMGFGDNSKSAIVTRGLAEIIRFGEYFGADFKTFSGLTGVGDLITTCTSKHSRNRHVGEALGKGETIDEVLSKMVMVAEGVPTIKAVYEIAAKEKISMPIIEALYEIVYNKVSPKKILPILMARELKDEFY